MPFRAALSGLNAASSHLQVIGNNVANASTTGFKQSRTEFADVFAVSNLGSSADAIGVGVRVANVTQLFSQGNIEFTENGLDLAINGEGFFRLNDGGSVVYSRDGAFSVDNQGFIVNNRGHRLVGNLADNAGNITAGVGDLRITTGSIAPQATSNIEIGLNLDTAAAVPALAFDVNDPSTYNATTSLSVFDSQGNSHLATAYYRKTATNQWESHLFIGGTELTPTAPATGGLTFDVNGVLTAPAGGTVAYDAFTVPGSSGAPLSLTIDYTGGVTSTQFGAPFSVSSLVQDGFSAGELSGIDIAEDGTIQARFSNGRSRALGQVQLYNFANPQGLRQLGDNTWVETFDSGTPLPNIPGQGGSGLLQSGALEASNVDLTEELVAMITAQRNFQANAEVITTADAITQTIINIR